MVPARSSRHGISCSWHLSPSQAEIPLIPAVQISRASSARRCNRDPSATMRSRNAVLTDSISRRMSASFSPASKSASNLI
ncbi:hypothetical protein ELG71_36535 [Rhizobium leguminosarum]|nr:hypothetical protein ELG71_36535 [Rhizobium leguminosarum]